MKAHNDETVAATPAPAATPEPSRVLLHMPVSVRSATLIVLAVLAVLFTLRWAAAFFIPVMVGFMFSYALSPVVDALERWRIPRALSAGVLILGLLGGLGFSAYSFSDDANQLISSLPEATQKLRGAIRSRRDRPETPLETVQKAATQLEQAAEEASPKATAPKGDVQRVVIEKPRFDLREHLWNGTLGLVSLDSSRK